MVDLLGGEGTCALSNRGTIDANDEDCFDFCLRCWIKSCNVPEIDDVSGDGPTGAHTAATVLTLLTLLGFLLNVTLDDDGIDEVDTAEGRGRGRGMAFPDFGRRFGGLYSRMWYFFFGCSVRIVVVTSGPAIKATDNVDDIAVVAVEDDGDDALGDAVVIVAVVVVEELSGVVEDTCGTLAAFGFIL